MKVAERLEPGYYTVVLQHREMTIRLEPPPANFTVSPGTLVAAAYTRGENDSDRSYTKFAFVSPSRRVGRWRNASNLQIEALDELLTSSLENAGRAYSLESGNCYKCGRLLTKSTSIEAGIGPVCKREGRLW